MINENNNSNNFENKIDGFEFCKLCSNYVREEEMRDHIVSHQVNADLIREDYEEEQIHPNNNIQTIRQRIHHRNNNNNGNNGSTIRRSNIITNINTNINNNGLTRRRNTNITTTTNTNTTTSVRPRIVNKQSSLHKLLSLLPQTTLTDKEYLGNNNKDCIICLDAFEINDRLTTLPCTHFFHCNCLEKWVKKNRSCPVCKFSLLKKDMIKFEQNYQNLLKN